MSPPCSGKSSSDTAPHIGTGGADLRHPSEIEDLITSAVEVFGAIDILVNNAVVRHAAPVERFSPDLWDEAMAVNLSAAFHAVRLTLR